MTIARGTLAIYTVGDDLADLDVYWQDTNGNYLDFSTGWTFQIVVYDNNGTKFTTATGFTGKVGSKDNPSVTKQWATTLELTTLTKGDYSCRVRAVRSSDNRQRTQTGTIRMLPDS